MKNRSSSWVSITSRWGIGITLGLVSLYLALRNISLVEVRDAFNQASWEYIGLALISVMIGVYAKVMRWQVLLGEGANRVKFRYLIMSHLAGQSLNMIYPARAGDFSRVYVLGEFGLSRTFVLGTVVLEKIWDLFFYAMVFVFLILWIPLPGWVNEKVYSFTVITAIFFIASILMAYQRQNLLRIVEKLIQRMPASISTRLTPRINAGLTSLDVMHSRKEFVQITFWSTVVWITAIANNYLVLLALRQHLPIMASVLILVTLQAGISLPTIPGRLGIFQYICILSLGFYRVDQAMAFSYSVLLHTVALLTIIVSGLVCIWLLGIPMRDKRQLNGGTA